MKAERWHKIEEVLDAALEISDKRARGEFVNAACSDDAELRREVFSLLAGEADAENLLQTPAIFFSKNLIGDGDGNSQEVDALVGQTLGNYKIERELGCGGMGAVYLAWHEQAGLRRQVALKLLKRELNTANVRRRFRHELEILNRLEHPHITRLLDAGQTPDGVPYFAMEYVKGTPINRFCSSLPLEKMLELFCEICETVAFAHRNLVIHCDLKPSNIFVTADGEIKLLDFGIAKLLSGAFQGDKDTATNFGAMTLDYASPEQLRGEAVTTATDVYSLGVCLYELLTGTRPFNRNNLRQYEIYEAVFQKEPIKPSRALLANSDKIRLAKKLKGDLDNIVLKALDKDPSRRYQTVEAFAEDIKRYLRSLPVNARPAAIGYRTAKFVKRHKFGVLATVLLVLSLVIGTTTAIWQAQKAAAQAAAAQKEKVKAEKVSHFLEQILRYSNPILSDLRKSENETTVREILDEAARRLESGETNLPPDVHAELERTIGETYYGRGDYQRGREYIARYVAATRQTYGENHPKMLAASSQWAVILFAKGDLSEAETIFRQILPAMRAEAKRGNIEPEKLASALNDFAYLRRTQGDSAEAEQCFRETLELFPQMSPEDLKSVATTRATLASTVADQGRFAEALEIARQAVAEFEERGEIDSPNYAFALVIYGGFLTENNNLNSAEAALGKAEAKLRKLLAPSHLWLGDCLRNQAALLYAEGRYVEAISRADAALEIYKANFGEYYDHYPTALILKGLSLSKLDNFGEGEKCLRQAVRLRTETLPREHFWIALAESALGECLTAQKRFAEAEPMLEESYRVLKNTQGTNNPRTIIAQDRLINFYIQRNKN
jgi:tetratricopeptide (TPR) repeat protein